MDTALITAWLVGIVVAWYPASQWLLRMVAGYDPRDWDNEDRGFAVFIGFFVAFLWPAYLGVVLLIMPWFVSRWIYRRSPLQRKIERTKK